MRFTRSQTLRASKRAFTLLEILVVLAILGLLVGVLIKGTGSAFDNSQQDVARIFVQQSVKAPLTAYRIDMGGYPSTTEGLQALIAAPQNREGWRGPYLETSGGKLPVDPWKEPYMYRYPGTRNKDGYDIFSKGPDKTEGTADDIGNW